MLEKIPFEILAAEEPLTGPINKFGGQPDWEGEGQWPLGPSTEEPMTFLAQIQLQPPLFAGSDGAQTALLFFEAESEPLYDEAFAWILLDANGEVISRAEEIDFGGETEGARLFELDENRDPVFQDYALRLGDLETELQVPLGERYQMGDLDDSEGYQFSRPELAGNKLGGQPLYIGSLSVAPEVFQSDDWEQLLQLAPRNGYWDGLQPNFYPFLLELGEFGILTVFISTDRTALKVSVQQP